MYFLWIRMANISSWSSSSRDIQYRADLWITRRITGIVESPTGRHSAFVINFIKWRYLIYRNPCVCFEIIIEAISSNSFEEFPNADKLVMVVPLKPIAKQFPKLVIVIPIATVVHNHSQPHCVTQNFSSAKSDWRDLLCESISLTEPKNIYMGKGQAKERIETLEN